jgi:hypothetical protein
MELYQGATIYKQASLVARIIQYFSQRHCLLYPLPQWCGAGHGWAVPCRRGSGPRSYQFSPSIQPLSIMPVKLILNFIFLEHAGEF